MASMLVIVFSNTSTLVAPVDVEDGAETSLVETFQGVSVRDPRLRKVQEGSQYHSSVNDEFCDFLQVLVAPPGGRAGGEPVFFRLISRPQSWTASAKQDVTCCMTVSVWATRVASSAKSSS